MKRVMKYRIMNIIKIHKIRHYLDKLFLGNQKLTVPMDPGAGRVWGSRLNAPPMLPRKLLFPTTMIVSGLHKVWMC